MSDDEPNDGDPDEGQDDSEPSVWDEIEEVAGDDPTPSNPTDEGSADSTGGGSTDSTGESPADSTDAGWVEPETTSGDDRIGDPNVDATTNPTVIDGQSPETETDSESAVTDATIVDDQFSGPASEATDATVVEDRFPDSNPDADAADTTDAAVIDDQVPGPGVDTSDAVGDDPETAADDQLLDAETDADAEPDADEMFEQRDVSSIDGESLWDELANTDTEGPLGDEALGSAGESVEDQTDDSVGARERETESVDRDSPEGEEALIDKRAYCQQCPYFTEPPEVHCTHDGTTIVEVLEDGRFRVTSCPVVTETGPDRTILNDGS